MSLKYTTESFAQKVLNDTNGKFSLSSEYLGCRIPVTLTCNDCGMPKTILPYNINRAESGCAECIRISLIRPIVGETSLWDTRPDVASLLTNPNDGYLYKENSHQQTMFTCPICGKQKPYIISTVSIYGFSCDECSDGISYPNKFMRSVFNQLNIDFIPEFNEEWLGKYKYDFYFELDNQKYCVEADGGMGHGYGTHCKSTKTLDELKGIDDYKDVLAAQHDIKVIRIDCNYCNNDRCSYIFNNILNSELTTLFDLSVVDALECDRYAITSLFKAVCDLWNNGTHNIYDIAKEVNLHPTSITSYLKRSAKLGMTDYDHDEYKKQAIISSRRKSADKNSFVLLCVETQEIFKSVNAANAYYHCYVSNYLNGKSSYAGKLSDGTKLHWKVLDKTGVDYSLFKDKPFYSLNH